MARRPVATGSGEIDQLDEPSASNLADVGQVSNVSHETLASHVQLAVNTAAKLHGIAGPDAGLP